MRDFCGARNRKGQPCRRPAGWGTNHVGEGRCKLHGGCSTGPKDQRGNKNAITTGQYETIFADVLEAEERHIFHAIDTEKLRQIDEELRLITIRERRMLQRIDKLKAVSYTMIGFETADGIDVCKTKRKYESTLSQIQNIEDALTRVQAHKARLIRLKLQTEEFDLRREELAQKAW